MIPILQAVGKGSRLMLLLAVGIGIMVFLRFFDISIVDPTNTAWILRDGGDLTQHYVGSTAFRTDSWHFPIGKTTNLNYPEGVSVVYTDSNPLLSITAKIFRGVFHPQHQFVGLWYLLCWILQSVFGYLIVKKLTNDDLYALLSAGLLCLLPTQLMRVGHENLVGFWILEWVIYIYISEDVSVRRKQFLFFAAITTSALVHGYLTYMTIAVAAVWYISHFAKLLRLGRKVTILRFVSTNGLYGIAFVFILWLLGYFYNNPNETGLMGFGFYSMNINSPFNPAYPSYSSFLQPIEMRPGQNEGYQYTGFGILILLMAVAFISIQKHRAEFGKPVGIFIFTLAGAVLLIRNDTVSFYERALAAAFFLAYATNCYVHYRENNKNMLLLFLPATFCFLIALSHSIFLGHTPLLQFEIREDGLLAGFVSKFRASGRFFWLTIHVLLLSSYYLLFNSVSSTRHRYAILSILIIFQLLDLKSVTTPYDSDNRDYTPALSEEAINMIKSARSVNFVDEIDMRVAEQAILSEVKVNNFVTAHNAGAITAIKLLEQTEDLKNNRIDHQALYLLNSVRSLPEKHEFRVVPFSYKEYIALPPQEFKTGTGKEEHKIIKQPFDSLAAIINLVKKYPLVIITAQDDASSSLPAQFKQAFDLQFNTTLQNLGFRHSYLAVFENGHLVHEKLGVDKPVEFQSRLAALDVHVKSAGFDHGNTSSIHIDGLELSMKGTGLNIVALRERAGNSNAYLLSNFNTSSVQYPF